MARSALPAGGGGCVDAVTVCESEPAEALKFESPLYTAVMMCDPAASELVLHVALPLAGNAGEHRVVGPSAKVTVPVGVPDPGAVTDTVAVNVTACPTVEGFTELVTLVLVAAGVTVCMT